MYNKTSGPAILEFHSSQFWRAGPDCVQIYMFRPLSGRPGLGPSPSPGPCIVPGTGTDTGTGTSTDPRTGTSTGPRPGPAPVSALPPGFLGKS